MKPEHLENIRWLASNPEAMWMFNNLTLSEIQYMRKRQARENERAEALAPLATTVPMSVRLTAVLTIGMMIAAMTVIPPARIVDCILLPTFIPNEQGWQLCACKGGGFTLLTNGQLCRATVWVDPEAYPEYWQRYERKSR